MTVANVYQQRPTTGAKAESSLHHADLASLVGKGRKNAGVIVREKKLLGHLTIRGDGHDAAFAAEQKLREALGDLHIQIVNVSGGQQVLELSGPNVRQVLMKSTSYDVHPNSFPVGKAVGTVFAKSQLVIRHTAEDTWELVIRRSFSDYWWLWLQDAAAEYGLSVQA